jgi:hypothetical protein
MALWNSYQTVGKKEEVSDIISNISPTKTPFLSQIGKETIKNVLFQWQEDSLADPVVNAQVEGFDAVDGTLAPTVMRNNTTQIFSKVIKVANSVDAIDHYGRAKESAYQLSKKAAEAKRDLENALVGTKQTLVTGDSVTARQFNGVQAQIDATGLIKTGSASTAISETNLLSGLQLLYSNGVEPDILMVTPTDALTVANFAASSGRTREIHNGSADRQIVNRIDLYVSPFGEVSVQLNRWLAAGDSLLYSADMWKLMVFRNWFRETLAKTGDNVKMMIVGEFSLKHKNYKASAVIRRTA